MPEPQLSYCAAQVRRFDPDRFAMALFAPAERREALFALYAFNIEIAKTREVVSEPTLGLIRLQWWRDAVDGVRNGKVLRHEVVEPLATAISSCNLDTALIDRLIDAREADLDEAGPASLDCLVNYAALTGGSLAGLAVQVLGLRDGPAMQAATRVGTAFALAGILRAVPFHAAQGRILLPADLLAQHDQSEPDLLSGRPGPGLPPVVAAVAGRAQDELAAARALRAALTRQALPALLPATLASLQLGVLAREGFDPFRARVQLPHPFRHLRLAWAAAVGRY